MKNYEKLHELLNKRNKMLCRLHDINEVLEIDKDAGNIYDDEVIANRIRIKAKLKKLERKIDKIIENW